MRLADALTIFGGACLAIAGFLLSLLLAGVLLIADKPTEPRQYAFEVGSAVAFLLAGIVATGLGVWLVRRGIRRGRAGTSENA